jgi:DNA topoisomerase-1
MDSLDPDLKKQLQQEDLTYTSDHTPGFFRQKVQKEYKYYDLKGKVINDKKILERIDSLRIPPAWKDVWVCPKDNGHLQATGIDDRDRKQYLYHPDWIKISQENKFSKMVDFGLKLPLIRQKIRYDLTLLKLEKRKVLATVVWLLEHTFIRIGNEEYSKENKSYGLTTLHNKHVQIKGSHAFFKFKGKSGVSHLLEISNPTVVKTIKRCVDLPGYELFQFVDDEGQRHVVDSQDVNLFLKDITQDDFSAKDFRTWGATNLSADNFYHLGDGESEKLTKENIVKTVKKVATHLNNTVSVCKNYYIHPTVIDTYKKKLLVPHFKKHSKTKSKISGLGWGEYALIKLLQKN